MHLCEAHGAAHQLVSAFQHNLQRLPRLYDIFYRGRSAGLDAHMCCGEEGCLWGRPAVSEISCFQKSRIILHVPSLQAAVRGVPLWGNCFDHSRERELSLGPASVCVCVQKLLSSIRSICRGIVPSATEFWVNTHGICSRFLNCEYVPFS